MTHHTVQKSRKKLGTSAKAAFITIPAIILIFLIVVLSSALNQTDTQRASKGTHPGDVPLVQENSHVLNDAGEGAPTLVEFLDFECEVCGAVYPVIEDIRQKYDGKINYVVRYLPIPGHKNSMNAAIAVEASANQGRFEEMYRKMFETQAEWGEKQTSEAERFRSFAEELGLDMTAYEKAVTDPATQARVEEDFNAARALGLQGTPTFFLDGEILQPRMASDITDALDQAIANRG
ncbi:thioredoxin domain-containing protein [Lysinibacter sp. HNR]|uniref:DsbA family protein n=1 Tax=Lysinibacter sp. HNR TaxID=3031408 RepID=UPI0024350F1F|nr:thioredoxin domain-containing protein [Lysinibacter sp. HNR]WGD37018.1 thioredoxin domain-containing protein [Lysinibacter sp. HNR]